MRIDTREFWIQLLPFMSMDDILLWCEWKRDHFKLLKSPLQDIKLNWFWTLILKHHWKDIILQNCIALCQRRFRWSTQEYQAVYGELYRLFYIEQPDGPGQSAVSNVQGPPVSRLPLWYVPQPPASNERFPDAELLFVYSNMAKMFQQTLESNPRIVVHSNQILETKHPWGNRLPKSTAYAVGFWQKDAYAVEANFGLVAFSADTNQKRFDFVRFLLDFLQQGHCSLSFRVYGSLPWMDVRDLSRMSTKYAFVNQSAHKFVNIVVKRNVKK